MYDLLKSTSSNIKIHLQRILTIFVGDFNGPESPTASHYRLIENKNGDINSFAEAQAVKLPTCRWCGAASVLGLLESPIVELRSNVLARIISCIQIEVYRSRNMLCIEHLSEVCLQIWGDSKRLIFFPSERKTSCVKNAAYVSSLRWPELITRCS